jgi:hypothetical protein
MYNFLTKLLYPRVARKAAPLYRYINKQKIAYCSAYLPVNQKQWQGFAAAMHTGLAKWPVP